MTTKVIRNVFNAGELSPKVYGRVDIDKWRAGAKKMQNFIPLPQGGVVRRPGTEYIAMAKNNTNPVRLIPFVFSTTQAYIIEVGTHAGNGYARFFMNGGQIQTADADTKLLLHFDEAEWSTTTVDSSPTGHTVTMVNGAYITSSYKFGSGSLHLQSVANRYISLGDHADWNFASDPFTIDCWVRAWTSTGDGTYTLLSQQTDATHYHRLYLVISGTSQTLHFYVNNGGTTLDLSHTATAGDYDSFLLGSWMHIAVIRGWGAGANSWALCVNGTAKDTATNAVAMQDLSGTLYVGGEGASNTWNGMIDEFRISNGTARWESNFVLPTSQYPGGDNSGASYEVVAPYTAEELSSLQYTQSYDTLFITQENHAPYQLQRFGHNNWNMAAVSFTDAPSEWSNNNGYPRACCFYQDRLCFAGSTYYPSRFWASQTGNYTVMTTGANDDDGMVANLLSGTSDTIFWMVSGQRILLGTDTGIQSIAASTGSTTALTPTNKYNRKESYFGSSAVTPVQLGDIVIYAGNPASKVRELKYSWEADGYKSSELTVLASHLLEGYTVNEFAYQQSPNEIVWCRRSDGNLLALTYMEEQAVIAWSYHELGPSYSPGVVSSVAAIPGNNESEFWLAAQYYELETGTGVPTANSHTNVDRMRPFQESAFNNSWFVDSGMRYYGAASNNIDGVEHLAKRYIYLLDADTGNVSYYTTNNNAIVGMNNAVSDCIFGLAYQSRLDPMPPVIEAQNGSDIFRESRVVDLSVLCRNSAGGTYGPDNNTQTVLFNQNTFTDGIVVDLSVRGNYDPPAGGLVIRTDELFALNIDAIGMEVE